MFFLHFSKCSINIKDTWRGIEVVITGLTRNQFASNRTWVRIPSSPPKSPVNSRVFWTFPFSRQGVDLAKNAGNQALFRLFFARLLELAMSEKPYISRLFGVALIFLQELSLPSLTFGVRKHKNIVHNVRGSDLWFVVQMTVNIRRRADITMTEPFLYLLHRDIVCKKQWCAAVSEVMEANMSQAVSLQNFAEVLCYRVGIEDRSHSINKDIMICKKVFIPPQSFWNCFSQTFCSVQTTN